MRFGEIKGVVGTNHVPSDDIAPVMAKWYGPPAISANAWHCIEVEFNGAATYNALERAGQTARWFTPSRKRPTGPTRRPASQQTG